MDALKAPFPWFGGKSRVAHLVWPRFGEVPNYVEPFFGSGALLLGRPHEARTETVNDLDGFVANFWRAVVHDPEAVARWADAPCLENDLHARHAWLVGQAQDLPARMEGDPAFFDAQIAGWWCWGICLWIGSGFCSGRGPWRVVDGRLVCGEEGEVERKRIALANGGRGVNRQLLHLGDKGQGVARKRQRLSGFAETGVNAAGSGDLFEWFAALSTRLRRVRVCCGDWSRICGPSVTHKHGVTGVFLDPPYADTAERAPDLYRRDCGAVAHRVREWALAEGANPLMRIALCGYEGEHAMPPEWECVAWKAPGGYGSQAAGNGNGARERIWFSPHCLTADRQREMAL